MEAKFIRVLSGFAGRAELFQCDPPMVDYHGVPHEYVVASTATVPYSGIETYFFPADRNGKVTSWLELPPSARGSSDIDGLLGDAGYTVVR